MKLKIITSPQFKDKSGRTWPINCNKDLPCYKEHMDKIIAVTLDAYNRFTRMCAFHLWIRLNKGKSIIDFTNMLKKHYQVAHKYEIAYIRVNEVDDPYIHEHYHFMIYLDTHKSKEFGLGYLIQKHVGEGKHLLNYGIKPWRFSSKKPWKIISTEKDLEDVINRASYLAKTRSKQIGAGRVTISTSRVRGPTKTAD